MSNHSRPLDAARPHAPPASRFPAYPASWYLFGRSTDVRDRPVPKRMLGRDLVAYRTVTGRLAMLDARCSHLGANLGYGRVCGELIECPFHNWKYGPDGGCADIPSGDPIPPFAGQMSYPVVERHGYIFFFNGSAALFPLPFFVDADPIDYAAGRVFRFTGDCPWYVTTAHGFDLQHFRAVHDRRLLDAPIIDCPAPYARRNHYRAEVLGRTRTDRWLKSFAGPTVHATITTWGGTFVVIEADFARAQSRFMIISQPLENGHTLCEGLVFATRTTIAPIVLEIRRFFTHGYLQHEADTLRQTRYHPSSLVDADRAMAEYFQWLADLPQTGAPALDPERSYENTLASSRMVVGTGPGRRAGAI